MPVMIPLYKYSKEDFIFDTNWNEQDKSAFDNAIICKWTALQGQRRFFRYTLKIDDSKILPGEFKFLAQVNVDRGTQKRKPVEVQTTKQKFDPEAFNFTKVDEGEILFEMCNKNSNLEKNYLAINVSPMGFGHCLLLPSLYDCLPQVITESSFITAIEIFLLSKSPAFRLRFNGLCANATVNHLHFHLYYLEQEMMLETIEVEHLAGPCYTLLSFPSRGFAFQLSQDQNIERFARNVFKLVDFIQENDLPHNITVSRGSSFHKKSPGSLRDHVRVYVWVRKPTGPRRDIYKFVDAAQSFSGHLMIDTQENFDSLTEDYVNSVLFEQTEEPFQSVLEKVRDIFQET